MRFCVLRELVANRVVVCLLKNTVQMYVRLSKDV